MGIFSSLKIHNWRWEMKTRFCNLKGEDLKESQGLLWPEYKLEKALPPPGGSLSRGLGWRTEQGGFQHFAPQPGALVQDMACTNWRVALGGFADWSSISRLERRWRSWEILHAMLCEFQKPCDNPCFSLHYLCSTLWNLWCLFHQHIPHLETFKNFLPTLTRASLTTKTWTLCSQMKTIPKQCQRDTLSSFLGQRCCHLKSRKKLDPCSRVTALMEVLSLFALNFKQGRL